MNRREFSTMVGLGAFALGTAAGSAAAATTAKSGGAGAKVLRKDRKAWAKEHFKGFENVLMPSFTPDMKKLDEEGIRLDVRKSIEHGFFSTLCACIGLTDEETRQFLKIAVDEAKGKISVAFAQGGNEADGSNNLQLIKDAEQIGCQHMILSLPRTGSAQELIKIGTEVSEATNMGIYLWQAQIHDFKRFHKSRIPFEVYDALVELPNIVALKVGDPDPATMFQLFERYNDKMLIGALMMNIMPFGIKAYGQQWSGAWTVEALQTPEKRYATDFFNLMMAGDYDKGMQLYWKYVEPAFGAMMKVMGPLMPTGGHPWEHLKIYQFLGGGNGGRMRKDPHQPNLPKVTEKDLGFVQNVFRSLELNPAQGSLEAFLVGRKNYEKGVRLKDLKDLPA